MVLGWVVLGWVVLEGRRIRSNDLQHWHAVCHTVRRHADLLGWMISGMI